MRYRDDGELKIENRELDSEWKEVRIGNVLHYISDKIKIENVNIIDYVSTENIVPNYGGLVLVNNLPNVDKVNKFKEKNILISNIRPYFKKIWLANRDGGCSNDVLVLEVKDNVDEFYVYYNLACDNFFDYVMAGSKGTKMPRGDKRHILNYFIYLPSIDEQKAIAHILSTLDKKIEVNNQINKTLEEMAQSIFKHWFIDFEFPNERGEPYKSNGGEMVDSEFGMIPKGWKVDLIGNKCACILGGTPSRSKPEFWGGCIPWINSGKVNDFRVLIPSETITDIGLEESATKLLPEKTTLLAITGATLGRVSLLEIDSCTNQSVVGIIENNEMPYSFIYPYIKSIISNIISHQTGGAQQHINKGNIENTAIIIPSNEIMIRYNKINRALYDTIGIKCFENLSLEQLRDTLLPKLMSGEIRVPLENGKLRMEN